MMAAMAQQDCGQCGYNCQDYADAMFAQERRAAEPLRAGRQGNRPDAQDAVSRRLAIRADARRRRRHAGCRCFGCTGRKPAAAPAVRATIPVEATFLSRTRLNKPGSEKETWHVEFDLTGSGLDYTVGDAFGLFPTNDPALADAVIEALDAPPDFPIGGRTLREVLIDGVSLVARARHAVPAVLLHHRRRAPAEGQGAGRRRGPGRRRRDARRARGDREIPRACGPTRKPSSRRSIRCSRGSIRSRRRRRSIAGRMSLTRRHRALRHRRAHTARRRLDLPRRAASTPATRSRSMCRRRTPSACRPIRRCRSS